MSTFALQKSDGHRWGHTWDRVRCGGSLDFHWGDYDPCDGATAAKLARARGAEAALAARAGEWLQREFRCSRESPFTTWRTGEEDGVID